MCVWYGCTRCVSVGLVCEVCLVWGVIGVGVVMCVIDVLSTGGAKT